MANLSQIKLEKESLPLGIAETSPRSKESVAFRVRAASAEKWPVSKWEGLRNTSFVRKNYENLKRSLDLFGALFLLILFAPVMLLVAGLVLITSRGPVVFSQERLTKGGVVFTMYKFRSMRLDAELKTGAVWAQSKDPRITPIGKFLRISRLDELPQLFNVIRGDMSLIGPRPERPEIAKELAKQLPGFERRLEVKAGLTGMAQVAAGYASCVETYRKKLEYDLYYVEHFGPMLDIKIALKTVIVMLTGSGAR